MPEIIGPCQLYHGDCLEVLAGLPAASVDMVLSDLPYGSTSCAWDTPLPLDVLWELYARVVRPDGAIVLTAAQPFAAALVMSRPRWFRHDWIWQKSALGNFMNAKHRPLAEHEHVLVFGQRPVRYFPQLEQGTPFTVTAGRKPTFVAQPGGPRRNTRRVVNVGQRYPRTIQHFPFARTSKERVHPTQKPVALCAYFVRTYSRPGDVVLDNCAGSGTTGVACVQEGRRSVLIEREAAYYALCAQRVAAAVAGSPLFRLPVAAPSAPRDVPPAGRQLSFLAEISC